MGARARLGDGRVERRVRAVAFTRKDGMATVLTALAVLAFAATHEGWNVWLIGGSHRWAAGAIALLGVFTCGLGSPGKDVATKVLTALGIAALVLAVFALVSGSITALSLLTVDIVLLWAASMVRHGSRGPFLRSRLINTAARPDFEEDS
jgi:hypothetical protein